MLEHYYKKKPFDPLKKSHFFNRRILAFQALFRGSSSSPKEAQIKKVVQGVYYLSLLYKEMMSQYFEDIQVYFVPSKEGEVTFKPKEITEVQLIIKAKKKLLSL